jgi:hypothetical protein
MKLKQRSQRPVIGWVINFFFISSFCASKLLVLAAFTVDTTYQSVLGVRGGLWLIILTSL